MLRLIVLCFAILTTAAFSQSVSFGHKRYASKAFPTAQADLNGDGVLDLVTVGGNATGKTGFYVTLSNPDGSYQAPVFYTSPYAGGAVSIALGDFNRDGKVDVAEVESTSAYFIFLNRGNGTLSPSWNFSIPESSNYLITTADFNRDGKLDLVISDGVHGVLQLLYGSGYGTFSTPFKISSDFYVDNLLIGDYDSDGNADLATTWAHCDRGAGCATHIQIFYGDGKGGFSASTSINYAKDYYFNWSDDVNSDPFSDLYGYSGQSSSLRILYGNANRTFTVRDVPLTNPGTALQAVDLNGDGIKDLAVIETAANQSNVVVLLGKSDGSYQPEQIIYSNTRLAALLAERYNRDTKPDLMAWQSLDASNYNGNFEFLDNSTSGGFPSCNPPNASAGIAVCAPPRGGSVLAPVKIEVAAAFTSPVRKTEVWIDGVKLRESFNSYATYSFLDGSFNLGPGPHRADVFSAAYDNRLQHSTVSFNIGTTSSVQYDVSLFSYSGPSTTPVGEVTVNAAGVTTVELTKGAANATYTVQFCPAPANIYPTCSTVGSVSTNARGAVISTIAFPSGSWAGDFELLTGNTIEFATSVYQSNPSTYYATLLPDISVNGKGTWTQLPPGPPQAPLQSGSITMSAPGVMTIVLKGTIPNTSWSGSQCPLYQGSDCYAIQTGSQNPRFTTNSSGNATYTAGLISGLVEDIFYVSPNDNSHSGFVAGFTIP